LARELDHPKQGLRVLVLRNAVNTWSLVIPVIVLPDCSKLQPFRLVVSIRVF
jgi:hypothetical protein